VESSQDAVAKPVAWDSEENSLFLNPRLSDEVQSHYQKIFKETCYRHGIKSHLVFLTSGTTVLDQKSYKMVFISKEAFMVSAQSVAKSLITTPKDTWVQCLPRFHVGGLAIEARSRSTGFNVAVFDRPWNAKEFTEFIVDKNATWGSLVPAQIFDLVKEKILCPLPSRFRILVGGARISPNLLKEAQDLKWNLLPSYGMTECSSTIATFENEMLRPFPHIKLEVVGGKLAIKTKSLFSFYAQVIKGQIEIQKPELSGSYFISEDSATQMKQGIMLLGRKQDVVKIFGELVSLPKLRDTLFRFAKIERAHSFYLIAVPDPRAEHRIVLLVTKDLLQNEKVKAESYELNQAMKEAFVQYQGEVLPFEKIRNVYVVESIPRTELGKVQEKILLQMVEKGEANEIREHKLE
jgi:o-succinylbenzoate---CoA ligase